MSTPTQEMERIARAVSTAIKGSGHSQRDIAAASGIPLATLTRRLSGRSPFTVVELAAIGEVIGVKLSDLTAETPAAVA